MAGGDDQPPCRGPRPGCGPLLGTAGPWCCRPASPSPWVSAWWARQSCLADHSDLLVSYLSFQMTESCNGIAMVQAAVPWCRFLLLENKISCLPARLPAARGGARACNDGSAYVGAFGCVLKHSDLHTPIPFFTKRIMRALGCSLEFQDAQVEKVRRARQLW